MLRTIVTSHESPSPFQEFFFGFGRTVSSAEALTSAIVSHRARYFASFASVRSLLPAKGRSSRSVAILHRAFSRWSRAMRRIVAGG